MHIENMKAVEEILASKIKSEFEQGIECVNTEEMGAAVDMLKDIESALYHATVTLAMDEYGDAESEYSRRYYDNYRYANGRFAPKGHGTRRGYEEPPYWHLTPDQYREWEHGRDIDRESAGRMYYTEPGQVIKHESEYDRTKRAYTESKAIHGDNTPESKQARMKDLETYLKELSSDITSMINDMTNEEKQLAKQKLSVLITKF